MKGFLDETCAELNKRWNSEAETIRAMADDLDKAIAESIKVFPKGELFSLWLDSRFEGRFNRTVFDVFTYYLSLKNVRKAIAGKHQKLRKLFEMLCEDNEEFRQSLQVTTKSLGAVHTRFSIFGRELGRITKLNLRVPTLRNKRLTVE